MMKHIKAEDLQQYSDEDLFIILRIGWDETEESRLRELVTLEKNDALTKDEQLELEELMSLLNHVTLLRLKASLLLKEFGFEVD